MYEASGQDEYDAGRAVSLGEIGRALLKIGKR